MTQSLPAEPAQPNQLTYSLQALELFERFTRESFLAKFGVQAPPYDPIRRIKTWFDSSAAAGGPYQVALTNEFHVTAIVRAVMDPAEASSVNLPGSVDYPVWNPPPVRGYWNEPTFPQDRHPIDHFQVCTVLEATALVKDIGAVENAAGRLALPESGKVVNAREDDTFAYFYDPDETRRAFVLTLPGGAKMYCGQLLKWKYAFGVGAPGHWTNPTGNQPVWVHDLAPQTLPDIRPWREVPIRALKANERITDGPFGPAVIRTDLMPADAGSGGLTADQARSLSNVEDATTKIGRQMDQLVPAS